MTFFNSAEDLQFGAPAARRWISPVIHGLSDGIPFLLWFFVGLSLLYACTIAYGFAAGYALPTTALFSVLPHGEIIARRERYLPPGIFLVSIVGASLGWLAKLRVVDASRLRRNEIAGARLFFRWGLLLLCSASILTLSGSGWARRITYGFETYASLAGLLPHSDAADHFLSPMVQLLTGSWNIMGSRRPLAAGLREITMALTDFSYIWTLLFQALLISAALFAAVRSIILWRGLWAGLAFCALIYTLARPFLSVLFTEPLGLIWALLAVMFLVEAMRLQETRYAYLGLVALTFAEITRMGSLFTIPALVLWIAFAFGATLRQRLRVFTVGCVLVALVLLIQKLCADLYGSPGATTGDNFSYTLCGLAVGGNWTSCPKLFAQEFGRLTTEREHAGFMYSKAVEMIYQNPKLMISSMYQNVQAILDGTLNFMLVGYSGENSIIPERGLLVLVPGLFLTMWRKRAHGEPLFWILMFTSMLVSAAIIFQDDGWRVMYVTWPLVALFLSLGCASPVAMTFPARCRPLLSVRGGALMIAAVVALIIVTPGLTTLWLGPELAQIAKTDPAPNSDQAILFGRTLTGFLVIPDDAPKPKTVPAVHATDFAEMIRHTEMERDFGEFLDATMMQVPFAFVTAARINNPSQGEQIYVAPAEILTTGSARAWRVTIGDHLHNRVIRDVSAIEALR